MSLITVMPGVLPPLPYAYDALEPYIDAKTMQLHHDMHHAAYIANLDKALAEFPGLESQPVDALLLDLNKFPEPARTQIRNNGGGHYNHSLFWTMMKKGSDELPKPRDVVNSEIIKHFNSFGEFQQQFNDAAKKVFGSGWAWLCLNADGKLVIISTPNQDAPIMQNLNPILGLDVWEHAYYLKYNNKRPSYIDAWWHVVNWDQVEDYYRALTK
jgi:Fe-Mn family superoxide dismutase